LHMSLIEKYEIGEGIEYENNIHKGKQCSLS
jgi:hypothetical protein